MKKFALAASFSAVYLMASIGASSAMTGILKHDGGPATPVAFGCGRDMHPNPMGRCVPNRVEYRRPPVVMVPVRPVMREAVCPRGTHPSRGGHRCVANGY